MMTESYDNNAFEIMQKCLQALQKQPSAIPNELGFSENNNKKKDHLRELFTSTINSCISPVEQSQNNKIIDKLRKKNNKKKQFKEVVIRKTDLGENQLIFTKQELEKLKQIDDDQLYGLCSPSPTQEPSPNHNLVNTLSPEPKKYFATPPNFDNSYEEIINYLDWVDTKELKTNKNKKKSKILNFQKRERSSSNSLESFSKKLKNPLPVLMPKISSPFGGVKNFEMKKTKSCYPLIKKNSVDKGFLKSINTSDVQGKRFGQKQKLNDIILKVNEHIEKQFSSSFSDKKYIYMTEERKQALFECEVLRKIKREIGPKFYQNLQLSYGNNLKYQKTDQDDIQYEKQNDQRSNFNSNKGNLAECQNLKKAQSKNMCLNGKEKNYTAQKEKITFESQAQKIIHKNRNRLKEERKRVIQRIVC